MTTLNNTFSVFETSILNNLEMLAIRAGGPGDNHGTDDADSPNIMIKP